MVEVVELAKASETLTAAVGAAVTAPLRMVDDDVRLEEAPPLRMKYVSELSRSVSSLFCKIKKYFFNVGFSHLIHIIVLH